MAAEPITLLARGALCSHFTLTVLPFAPFRCLLLRCHRPTERLFWWGRPNGQAGLPAVVEGDSRTKWGPIHGAEQQASDSRWTWNNYNLAMLIQSFFHLQTRFAPFCSRTTCSPSPVATLMGRSCSTIPSSTQTKCSFCRSWKCSRTTPLWQWVSLTKKAQ